MRRALYAPKPEIENHHYIQDLISSQEKRVADRTYHQDRIKQNEERDQDINAAPMKDTKPFYCEKCKKDFMGEAIKQVEVDWSNTNQHIAFYRSKCFCGKWCMRLITDKNSDRYWFKSKKVAQDRGNHFQDLIQGFETNYQLLYGKK